MELEHLKIETRLTSETPVSEMGVKARAKDKTYIYVSVVYYESIKRELKTKPIYECRCNERPKPKAEESTRLACTGVHDKTN